ncbi:MAG: HAD family hydrolase [Candidatus Omnitrophica bacterium]|nr:HAD family hydrolase [Candidatus Omnitrophota bacterium]
MDKLIFIDRDGVINRDPGEITREGYVTRWEDFHFLSGALEAIKYLTDKGVKIAVISNQAGVGKGIYTDKRLEEITEKMLERIRLAGGRIWTVRYCVHTAADNCDCRKPKTGLLMPAIKDLDVNLAKTYLIGDKRTDIEAGNRAGLRTVLVLSGMTKTEDETKDWPIKPDIIKKDLKEAVEEIIKKDKDI